MASGYTFDPSPLNIETHTQRYAFNNGVHVAYLPTKTKGESVQVRMNLRFSNGKDLQNKAVFGQFTGQMLNKGTAKMTHQEITDPFDKLKVRVGVGRDATSAFVSIENNQA